MKTKSIISCVFAGVLVALLWWWQRTHSQSQYPDERDFHTKQASLTGPVTASEFPSAANESHLAEILKHPKQPPTVSTLAKLRAEDEVVLLREYGRKTNLEERVSLIWSLAYIGGDASLAAFQYTLTDEYAGHKLSGNQYEDMFYEAKMMFHLFYGIGLLAQRNDKAFDLLNKGTDPWFWQKNLKWKSVSNADGYGVLSGNAMKALGMSSRKELPEIFEALSIQPLINEPDPRPTRRAMNGALVDAAFYYSMVRDEGRDRFLEWLFTPKGHEFDADGKFSRWSTTPEGVKWFKWDDERNKANMVWRKDLFKQMLQK